MDFDGKIDFSGEEPLFNVYTKIDHVDVKALRLTEDSITANAEMKLDFSGSNIDNFVRSAYIYNMNIVRDSTRMNLDSVLLSSALSKGFKQLTLATNEVSASVSGQFSIMD